MSILQKIVSIFKSQKEHEHEQESESKNMKSPRRELYEFVHSHAYGDKKRINEMYIELYAAFQKKHKINLTRLAQSRNCKKTIDYVEQQGYCPSLLKLAKHMYQNQASELMLEFGKKA